jgi:UDP-N-acetylmuramoylalanine--D-glutamate ligase
LELVGQNVLVIGTKRSGLAAVELLVKQGARVRAMDEKPLSTEERAKFEAMGVPVAPQTAHNLVHDGRYPDMIVLSPAVPYDLPMLVSVRERGIPVIGEVELASYFLKGPVIGITGSNGKTTTTALTGHLLEQYGIACQVGGNIGRAVTSMVDSSAEHQWNVLEISSFQLESIYSFRAQIAACLNVTPDHLDRHYTFEGYASAKSRLFETQRTGDFAVLNYSDKICCAYAARTKAEVYWFREGSDGRLDERKRLVFQRPAVPETLPNKAAGAAQRGECDGGSPDGAPGGSESGRYRPGSRVLSGRGAPYRICAQS